MMFNKMILAPRYNSYVTPYYYYFFMSFVLVNLYFFFLSHPDCACVDRYTFTNSYCTVDDLVLH